ncbi:MAG: hypothetical protein M1819_003461 [Sarea resinae]|nr:MAG: hypothetical protein M1819_003461 [Sarea resinae]
MTALSSFPQFGLLPAEIRISIWSLANLHLPSRVIEVSLRSSSLLQAFSDLYGPIDRRPISPKGWHTITPNARKLPPTLHVNHEARTEARMTYQWLDLGCWFDYSKDTIYFGEEVGDVDVDAVLTTGGAAKKGEPRVGPTGIDPCKLRYLAILHSESWIWSQKGLERLVELGREQLKEVSPIWGTDDSIELVGVERPKHNIRIEECDWENITIPENFNYEKDLRVKYEEVWEEAEARDLAEGRRLDYCAGSERRRIAIYQMSIGYLPDSSPSKMEQRSTNLVNGWLDGMAAQSETRIQFKEVG